MASLCINVIIPVALRGVFTYSVPEHLVEEVIVGKRVVVPFGNKRLYSGIVYQMNVSPVRGTRIKDIEYVLDGEPIVTEKQLKQWEWMAGYYMCGLGEIMNAALPGSLRLTSQTQVTINEESVEYPELSELERTILAQIQSRNALAVDQLEGFGSRAGVQKALDRLFQAGLVEITEELNQQEKPQQQEFVVLEEAFQSNDTMSALMDDLTRAPKQLEVVMRFIELSSYFTNGAEPVLKPRLFEAVENASSAFNTLKQKGVFKIESKLKSESLEPFDAKMWSLNQEQKRVVEEIKSGWAKVDTALLHGITGSGKTQVYTAIAKEILSIGKQVLILVPEISLTTQLVGRVRQLLGQEVVVYHSRLSNRERMTIWMRLLSDNPPKVIMGARSAVFLPMSGLGFIVVDEEHDASYKQSETSPYYNARDVAVWIGAATETKVLLGSATPAVETYENALSGKYALSKLDKRFGDIKLPEFVLVDLKKSLKERAMKADFAAETAEAIQKCLDQKRQVIVFQNRRGYAPFQVCESCGWSAECDNCDVHLTYHRFFEKLMCHYCGYSINSPSNCPQCGSAKLKVRGFGTEKIETDIDILFPKARIGRVDLDTTRKKVALQNIITAFEEGSIDILVGTQMITKGMDFENVGLVVVMNSDSLWNRPDFRAFERSFQLLTQVAGRSGRKRYRGKVIVQTYRPDHPVLDLVIKGDYLGMYESQVIERRQFDYPPFSRLVRFQISHADRMLVKEGALFLAVTLRNYFKDHVLGPEEPSIARIRNKYIRQVYLKLDPKLSLTKSKVLVAQCRDAFEGHPDYRKCRLIIDVDPQ